MSAPSGGVKTLGWNRLYISIIFCPGRLEPGLIVMYMTGATKKQPEFIALNLIGLIVVANSAGARPNDATTHALQFRNSPTLSSAQPASDIDRTVSNLLSTYEI